MNHLKPQIISKDGVPQFVVLSYEEYENLLELLEDAEDVEDAKATVNDESESFPLEVVHELALGENTIKVFRMYRNFSQSYLAKKVGISKQYISQIENNEKQGSIKVLNAIANVLNLNLEDLIAIDFNSKN